MKTPSQTIITGSGLNVAVGDTLVMNRHKLFIWRVDSATTITTCSRWGFKGLWIWAAYKTPQWVWWTIAVPLTIYTGLRLDQLYIHWQVGR